MVQQAHHGIGKIISLWLPVAVWMGLIFYLSSISGLAVGEGVVDFWTRKPAHVFEYAVLLILIARALRGSNFRFSIFNYQLGTLLLAFLLSFFYAISDEFHQLFVPLREGKISDLGFDLLGILVGVLFLRFSRKGGVDSRNSQ